MSLINDALKRAREKQTSTPPPPLHFCGAEEKKERRLMPMVVGAALALIFTGGLGLLIVFLFMRQESRLNVDARTAPQVPVKVEPVQQAMPSAPAPVQTEIEMSPSAPQNPQARNDDPLPVPTFPGENDTNSLPVVAEIVTQAVATIIEPPKPEGPKLQGIFFNPVKPSAVVSGKNVYVGGVVGGSRVVEITHDTVTLISATATNVLSLSE